ncbi:MAG: hypothetical protein FWF15_11940, partial [Oscillospiraceae bacterium]|nr:hypothetical protein [Oscillospiraceae bacterium]
SKTEENNQQTNVGANDPSSSETKPDFPEPDLPADANFNGAAFTILHPMWSLYNTYYFAEENTGEVMNDALYERTTAIEDRLNIKIKTYCPGIITELPGALSSVVLAGDPAYDLMLTHCRENLLDFVRNQYLVDWNIVPYIDMDKPYWNKTVKDNHTMYGILLYNASDFVMPDTEVIFFNKGMITNYSLDVPYDLVNNGKWTWAKLKEMGLVVAEDLNGDGVNDIDDQFGFASLNSSYANTNVLIAANIRPINKAADYTLSVNVEIDKLQTLVSITQSIVDDKALAFCYPYSQATDPNIGNKPPIGIDSNRLLFEYVTLSLAQFYRTTEVEFGIIPIPKFDDKQENHSGLNTSGYMCIPQSAGDLNLVGMVCELLAAENRRTVLPAFYDIALGQKISRDVESEKMLDIIFSNLKYDLTWAYSIDFFGIKSDGISSFIDSNMTRWETSLENVMKYYREYTEG